jgi:hypothetical protein
VGVEAETSGVVAVVAGTEEGAEENAEEDAEDAMSVW